MQIPEASSGRIETKIEFANTLRGLAALSVLISHYFYTFWKVPSAVAGLIGAPALPVRSNMITIAIDALLPEGLIGHFGVAIFFLISGFVIPFAFLTRSRLEFAIGRVFRLWPTYAVGLTLSSLAVWACAASFGQPRPFPASTYLLQLLFVRDLWWVPSIDGIVWTLEIEAKFYLAAVVLAPAFRQGKVFTILATATVIALALLGASQLPGWLHSGSALFRALYGISLSGQMICYMLIGTMFNLAYRRLIGNWMLAGSVTLLFCLCGAQWSVGVVSTSFRAGIVSYAIALGVFSVAYRYRARFSRRPGVVGWLADISYPLYVVHGVAGYVIMRLLIEARAPAVLAVAAACVFAFGTAWVMHMLVELPAHEAGKRLGRSASAWQERRQGNKFLRRVAATSLVRHIKHVHDGSSHTNDRDAAAPVLDRTR